MIIIIRSQLGEDGKWHFKLGDIASNGKFKTIDISDPLTPEEWITQNAQQLPGLIDDGQLNSELGEKVETRKFSPDIDSEIESLIAILSSIDSMTATQVRTVVKRLVQENIKILRAMKIIINQYV